MNILCSIVGFQGQPVSILGKIDDETGGLLIAKSVPFADSKANREDFAFVANFDSAGVDFRFSDTLLKQAISDYFISKNQGMIAISDQIQRYDPEHRIERQGVDANGAKYAVSPDTDNGQMCILAMVCYWKKQEVIGSMMDAADEINSWFGVQTI